MTETISIVAHGTPIPQGSKSARVVKGRAVMYDANKRLKQWRQTVAAAATDAMHYHNQISGPTQVYLIFTFARPKSHYRTGKKSALLRDNAPRLPIGHGYGDADKLVRACFDALTTAGVWTDDAIAVDHRAKKLYAGEHEHALEQPGVRIQLRPIQQDTA